MSTLSARVVLALVAVALAGSAHAGAPDDTTRLGRLSAHADRLAAFGFSGQLFVSERGTVILDRASGWADRRFHVPMTTGTQLAVGSVTKHFVAAALLRLQSRHRLRLADRLAAHWPGVPADKAGVTLEQLLSHTAGLAPDVPDGLDDATRDELVHEVLARPLVAPPGARFQYSNAGFDVLAAVVERVSGSTFDAFLRTELLGPASLERTGIAGAPDFAVREPACGYEGGRRVAAWREWPAGWSGTGSGRLVTTARDLGRWIARSRDARILGADGWADLTQRRTAVGAGMGYGLGLWLRERPEGGNTVVIGGEVTGFRAVCRIEPDADRIVVVLTNDDHDGSGRARLAIANALALLADGQEEAQPPANARFESGSARALEGAWTLDGGGRLEIWEECGALRLGATGQPAVELLAPGDAGAAERQREIGRRTLALVRAVLEQDSAAARAAFSPDEFALGFPFLTRHVRGLLAAYGDLQRVEGLGAVESASRGVTRSQVRLVFLDHTTDVALGFAGGRLVEVGVGEGPPFAVLLPVAPVAGGGYAAYDLSTGRVTGLRPGAGADGEPGLVITTAEGERFATRAR